MTENNDGDFFGEIYKKGHIEFIFSSATPEQNIAWQNHLESLCGDIDFTFSNNGKNN